MTSLRLFVSLLALSACTGDDAPPNAGTIPTSAQATVPDSGASAAPNTNASTSAVVPSAALDAGMSTPPVATSNGSDSGAPSAATGDASTASTGAGPDGGTAQYSWPSECDKHYTLRAHNNNGVNDTSKKQIAPGSQYYASFYYRAPWGTEEVQGLKFRSIIDNKRIVHHWILYGVNSGSQQDGAVQGGQGEPIGSMQGEFYIAGWAPGAPDIALPDGVGLHLPTGTSATFRLEVHYYNTLPTATNEEDASGVEFCVTSHKRAAEAAIHWMGTTSVTVPGNAKTDIKSTCKPQITNGPVHLISLSSHMHKTGVHSSAILKRANGGPSVTLIDDPFSFMEQSGYAQPRDGSAPDVLINAGDTIDVTCSYDNTSGQTKMFGSNTEDEMCFFYAMAWPRGQLRNGALFSIVPGAEPEVNCIQ
jgi:Copper type II ascorbate-dependent monooxygenase, C-terminal domain/Copper type II ascorbate-dependent monooxygenase, N-terminal domain